MCILVSAATFALIAQCACVVYRLAAIKGHQTYMNVVLSYWFLLGCLLFAICLCIYISIILFKVQIPRDVSYILFSCNQSKVKHYWFSENKICN